MSEEIKDLENFQWKNRIILVKEDEKVAEKFRENADKIKDRDLIWFAVNNGKIETNFEGSLSEDFADFLNKNYFEKFEKSAFLIGKDGGIKSEDDKLDLENYFGQIDSMPMRQREMREDQ